MASDNGKSFLDKFAEVSAKVGNQVHLRSLRDAFATITPLYILAGIAVLINNVVFPLFPLDAAGLANLQTWGLGNYAGHPQRLCHYLGRIDWLQPRQEQAFR